MTEHDLKAIVQDKYGKAALRVAADGRSCASVSSRGECDPITSNLYESD